MNIKTLIENQKRGGKGDTLPEYTYYTNSYVERLKALGSNVQYSNYPGGSIATLNMSESTLYLTSIYINKTSTITGIGWVQQTQGNYTADNYNGVGLYSYDSINEKLILIASTINDGDIWKATGGAYTNKNFSTPIVVNSGIYYIGFLHNYSAITTAPAIQVPAVQTNISTLYNTIGIGTAKLSGTTITHTTLPTEVLNADITSTVITQNIYLY